MYCHVPGAAPYVTVLTLLFPLRRQRLSQPPALEREERAGLSVRRVHWGAPAAGSGKGAGATLCG